MIIKVDGGREYDAVFAYAPTMDGKCVIQLRSDDRPLSEIAREFEGADYIERFSAEEGDAGYTGYTQLQAVERQGDAVTITMTRPQVEGGMAHESV